MENANVNELCRKLRTEANLSVKELSDLTGMTEDHIAWIETSKKGSISLECAKKYSEVFGEKYFDELAAPLIRYDCGKEIGKMLEAKGVSIERFAKVVDNAERTVQNVFKGVKRPGGRTCHPFTEEEIEALASYFHTSSDDFKIGKFYLDKVSGTKQKKLWIPKPIISEKVKEPAKKTAQMIYEEEKKMEYEEALNKAKEYDILMAKNRDLLATADDLNKQLDAALGELNRANLALNEFKNAEPEVITVTPHDYESVKAENAKYKDILFKLLLERYERE